MTEPPEVSRPERIGVDLSQVNWADVGERLVAFALWMARHRLGPCRRWDDIGLGRSPEDLAREVISDLLLGRCRFEVDQLGGLISYLKQRLRWRLLNLWSSAAHRLEERQTELADGAETGDGCDARKRLEELGQRIEEYMTGRKRKFDLRLLFAAVQADPEASSQRLAEQLGIEREQVYYQLRLLRRLAQGMEAEEV